MNRILRWLGLWLPVLAWMGLIFFLSSFPHIPKPVPPGGLLDTLVSKTAHIIEYMILAWLSRRAFCGSGPNSKKYSFAAACLLSILYGAGDELHQSFVPLREPRLSDVGIDAAGAFLGAAMHAKTARLIAPLLLLALRTTGVSAQPPQTPPLMLVSLDGAKPDVIGHLMAAGRLPRMQAVAVAGLGPAPMTVVFPSLTPVVHAAILTGTYPEENGVLAITFHDVSAPITKTVSGFETPFEAETLVQAAKRQGKSVASVSWPGFKMSEAADWTVQYGSQEAYPFSLRRSSEEWKSAEGGLSFTALNLGGEEAPVKTYLLASPGSEKTPAALYVDTDTDAANGYSAALSTGQWAAVALDSASTRGTWIYLQEMSPDLSAFKLYVGAVYSTKIYPPELMQAVTERFGFFPGGGDYASIENGKLGEQGYRDQTARLDRWLMDAAVYVKKTYAPDLLLAYLPGIDSAQHQFLSKEVRLIGFVNGAYTEADRALGRLLEAAPLAENNLLLVSDHGMAPNETDVYVNRLLKQNGVQADGPREGIEARATASGGSAYVYINKKDREDGGWVPEDKAADLAAKIVELLRDLKDPRQDRPVFEHVVLSKNAGGLHLNHRNAGDVIAIAYPGYFMSAKTGDGPVLEPSSVRGMHGYDPKHEDMDAVFFAAGPSVAAQAAPARVSALDIAPTAAALLKISPPQGARSAALPIIKD